MSLLQEMNNEQPIPQHEAGRLFVGMLINECYETMVPEIMAGLQDGPPGGQPPADELQRSKWFQSLQAAEQKEIQGIIEYSLELCLFHLLNIFDGTSPVQPIKEQASDFAVYLQTYDSDEDLDSGKPKTATRVNPVAPDYANDEEQLHDIFSEMMNDLTARQ